MAGWRRAVELAMTGEEIETHKVNAGHLSARRSGRACSCFNQKTTACPESPVSVYQSPTIELMQHLRVETSATALCSIPLRSVQLPETGRRSVRRTQQAFPNHGRV